MILSSSCQPWPRLDRPGPAGDHDGLAAVAPLMGTRSWIADRSRKQFRCDSPRVGKHNGATQVVLENQHLARDFAEFADVMSVLLNSRRAAGDSGPAVGGVRFPPTRVRRYSERTAAYRVS